MLQKATFRTSGCDRVGRFDDRYPPSKQYDPAVSDTLPSFRTPAEQAAYAAVLHDFAGPDRRDEAVMVFSRVDRSGRRGRRDAMIRAGAVSDAL